METKEIRISLERVAAMFIGDDAALSAVCQIGEFDGKEYLVVTYTKEEK